MTVAPGATGYSKRSRLDKLGVKSAMRVAVLRLQDAAFLQELRTRTDDIAERRPKRATDMIFFFVSRTKDLERLARLRETIKPNGAIWTLWRKGRPEVKQSDVMSAAKENGLVDIKVASFSEELSALKLVIPVAMR